MVRYLFTFVAAETAPVAGLTCSSNTNMFVLDRKSDCLTIVPQTCLRIKITLLSVIIVVTM